MIFYCHSDLHYLFDNWKILFQGLGNCLENLLQSRSGQKNGANRHLRCKCLLLNSSLPLRDIRYPFVVIFYAGIRIELIINQALMSLYIHGVAGI